MKFAIQGCLLLLLVACSPSGKETLSDHEKHYCDSLILDQDIIASIRPMTAAQLEPFSLLTPQKDTDTKINPMRLSGLVFKESPKRAEEILKRLHDKFKKSGYTLFILERNFGIANRRDVLGILKTDSQYEVLKEIKTDGINYDIDSDSLIRLVQKFDKKYGIDLLGAGADWCEFSVKSEGIDWGAFANEVYQVCPDVVDQGAGTVDELAAEMKRTQRLYFWWD